MSQFQEKLLEAFGKLLSSGARSPRRCLRRTIQSVESHHIHINMEVSINGGSWMVDFMDYPIKMDDLGLPPFQESTICHAFRQRKVTNGMDLGVKAYPEMTSP